MAKKQPVQSPAELRPGSGGTTGHQKPEIRSQFSDFPADGMLTKKDLAAKLRVTVRTIENWQRAGHLPFIKISSVVLFHWPDVIAHLQKHFAVKPRGVVGPVRAGLATMEKLKSLT